MGKDDQPKASETTSVLGGVLNETTMEVTHDGTSASATVSGRDHDARVEATEKAAEKVAALNKAKGDDDSEKE